MAIGSLAPGFGASLKLCSMFLRSAPAQKQPPAPRRITTLMSRRSRSAVNTERRSPISVGLSAFLTSGRLSVTCSRERPRRINSVSYLFLSSGILTPRQRAHSLGDDLQHDLVGAAADRGEAGVAEGARGRRLPQVTGAAPVLQAAVGHQPHHAAGLQLGHRGEQGDVGTVEVLLAGAIAERTDQLDLGAELSELEMDDLVVEQRPAEHLALAGVLRRLVDQPLHADH